MVRVKLADMRQNGAMESLPEYFEHGVSREKRFAAALRAHQAVVAWMQPKVHIERKLKQCALSDQ